MRSSALVPLIAMLTACAGPSVAAYDLHTQRALDSIKKDGAKKDHKVTVCHPAGKSGRSITLEIDEHALDAHIRHGDHVVGDELCDGVDNDCNGTVDDLGVFEDFEKESDLELVGDASLDTHGGDGVLSLTPVSGSRTGAAWLDRPVTGDTFQARFSFETGGGTGADGLTFAFLDTDDTGAIGGSGGNLGARLIGYDGYVVEFDTWDNGSIVDDPNGNHAAIAVADTLKALDVNGSIPTLEDAGWFDVEVVAIEGDVEVWLDGTSILTATLPSTSDTVQVGFTASTGGATNRHLIDDFELSCPEFEPPPR